MPLKDILVRATVVAVVGLFVLGTVAAGVPSLVVAGEDDAEAQAADEPTTITSCTTITEPGEYVLTQDIAGNGSADACLRIDVNGTVVIDGQGHSIEGGIDAEAVSTEGDTLTLELSDATVDIVRYPPGALTGPRASGLLENVTVETIQMSSAFDLTIESTRVTNEITGLYATGVTLRNSTFEGRLEFHEDAREFEVVNNSFAETVVFYEHPRNISIAENTFQSSLKFYNAGGSPENVTVENNHLTVAATEANDLEAGGIMFVQGKITSSGTTPSSSNGEQATTSPRPTASSSAAPGTSSRATRSVAPTTASTSMGPATTASWTTRSPTTGSESCSAGRATA